MNKKECVRAKEADMAAECMKMNEEKNKWKGEACIACTECKNGSGPEANRAARKKKPMNGKCILKKKRRKRFEWRRSGYWIWIL